MAHLNPSAPVPLDPHHQSNINATNFASFVKILITPSTNHAFNSLPIKRELEVPH